MNDSEAEAALVALGPQLQWGSRTDWSSLGQQWLTFHQAQGTAGVRYTILGNEDVQRWRVFADLARNEPSHPYKRLPDAKIVCERHNSTGGWEQPTPFDTLMVRGGEAFRMGVFDAACQALATILCWAEQTRCKAALAHVEATARNSAAWLDRTIHLLDDSDRAYFHYDPGSANEPYVNPFTPLASRASLSYRLLCAEEGTKHGDVSDAEREAGWIIRQEWFAMEWQSIRYAEKDTP